MHKYQCCHRDQHSKSDTLIFFHGICPDDHHNNDSKYIAAKCNCKELQHFHFSCLTLYQKITCHSHATPFRNHHLSELPVRHTDALHGGKLMTSGNDIGHNQVDEVD